MACNNEQRRQTCGDQKPAPTSPFGYKLRRLCQAREGEDSLYEAIEKHGVLEPVEIAYSDKHDKQMLTNGHHRTVSAHSINPNMFVPIEYDNNPWVEWPSGSSTKTSSTDQSPSSYWRSYYRGEKK